MRTWSWIVVVLAACSSSSSGKLPSAVTGGAAPPTGGSGGAPSGGQPGTGGLATGGTVADAASTGGSGADAAVKADASVATDGGGSTPPPLTGKAFVYASSFEGGSTITTFALDLASGALTRQGNGTAGGTSPDYLSVVPGGKLILVNNEAHPAGRTTSMAVGPDGTLTRVNDQPSGGGGPAHVWAHSSGKWALSANYDDGKVAALPLGEDGKLGPPASVQDAGGQAHMVLDDGQSGRFVFVPCAAAGYVAMYKFDLGTGQLTPNSPPTLANGQRPRHMAFHPGGKLAFLSHEGKDALTTFAYDAATGLLSDARDTPAPSDGAHVLVHPNGNFVYHVARGGGAVTVYRVGADGTLTMASTTPVASPYDAVMTRDGRYLFTVGGTTVRVFSVDAGSGALTAAGMGQSLQRAQGVAVTVF